MHPYLIKKLDEYEDRGVFREAARAIIERRETMTRETREETEVKRVCSGSRLKMGTDWPIESICYRRGKPLVPSDSEKSKPWKVVFNLCNGVPTSTRFYRTKREALEALEG